MGVGEHGSVAIIPIVMNDIAISTIIIIIIVVIIIRYLSSSGRGGRGGGRDRCEK